MEETTCLKRSIFNFPDFVDQNGNWVKSFYKDGIQFHTRSGILWASLKTRTSSNEKFLAKRGTYRGCVNGFVDYNEFTDWCQTQFGYMSSDSNGKMWSIDKDIYQPFNLIYHAEKCLFVPNRLNQLFKSPKNRETMLGVCKRKYSYQSTIFINGVSINLGRFETEIEAHATWQKAKISHIRDIVKNDQEISDHFLLKKLLTERSFLIECELLKGVETKY